MLLPLLSAADSQLQTGAAKSSMHAVAHVSFKIVIPPALSLEAPASLEREPRSVAIFSNDHHVTLAATLGASEEVHGLVLLSAARRRIIAQKVACRPPGDAPSIGDADGIVCTASIP